MKVAFIAELLYLKAFERAEKCFVHRASLSYSHMLSSVDDEMPDRDHFPPPVHRQSHLC